MTKLNPSWETITFRALTNLGGFADLCILYREVERECRRVGRTLTATWPATVRRTLQQSRRFVSERKRSGVWRLAKPTPTVSEDTV